MGDTLQAVGTIESQVAVVELLPYEGCMIASYSNGVVKVFDSTGTEKFSHGPLGEHTTNTAVALAKHPFEDKSMLLCGQDYGYVTAYDMPEFRPRGTFTTGYDGSVAAIV